MLTEQEPPPSPEAERIGKRVRYSDDHLRADPEGRFETVNELLPGKETERCSANCAHLDTFLLETDITSDINLKIEEALVLVLVPAVAVVVPVLLVALGLVRPSLVLE